jgi:hypothetical protein
MFELLDRAFGYLLYYALCVSPFIAPFVLVIYTNRCSCETNLHSISREFNQAASVYTKPGDHKLMQVASDWHYREANKQHQYLESPLYKQLRGPPAVILIHPDDYK